jgi:hypothetical protein
MNTEATERIWWRTPRTAKGRKPASGGTTSGTRHILRDPTWVIGCKQTRNNKQVSVPQDCSPERKSLVVRPLRLQHISGLTVDQLQLSHLLPANVQTCVQYPEFLRGSGNSKTHLLGIRIGTGDFLKLTKKKFLQHKLTLALQFQILNTVMYPGHSWNKVFNKLMNFILNSSKIDVANEKISGGCN